MKRIDLTFNFVGMSVVAWRPAFDFFHKTLGMTATLRADLGDWANLGRGGTSADDTRHGANFELFDGGRAASARHWGLNQGVRPGLHVPDLAEAVGQFRSRGIELAGGIVRRPWGSAVEFATTEGVRFALATIPGTRASADFATPYIGHAAIKCADFPAMQRFYGDIIGYTPIDAGQDYAVYAQPSEQPLVILEPGGEASSFDPANSPWEHDAVRAFPVFISMMTPDIHTAAAYLREQGVTVLRDIRSHDDWQGTDLHIADPDGNGIQVVQYHA